jgi:hypothetical protein
MEYYLYRATEILSPLLLLILALLLLAALIFKLFQRPKPSGDKIPMLLSKELKEKYMEKYTGKESTEIDDQKASNKWNTDDGLQPRLIYDVIDFPYKSYHFSVS